MRGMRWHRRARRVHQPLVPPLWRVCCETFGVPPALAAQWWRAVAGSTWSEVVSWRRELLLAEVCGDPALLARTLWTPQKCMAICEVLVQEGRLERRLASAVEEALLQSMRQGQWK